MLASDPAASTRGEIVFEKRHIFRRSKPGGLVKLAMLRVEQEPELVLVAGDGRAYRVSRLIEPAVAAGVLPRPPGSRLRVRDIFHAPDPWRAVAWLAERVGDDDVAPYASSATICVPDPGGELFCAGRNYAEHVRELDNPVPGRPLIFMKPRASLIASGEPIPRPRESGRVDYEGELALVIGRAVSGDVSRDQARGAVFAVTLLNDVTDREVQQRAKQAGQPWFRAKGRRGFAPIGPALVPVAADTDLRGFRYRSELNGRVVQNGDPGLWIWDAAELVRELAATTGLRAGDVIATGTPAGVGPLHAGDRVAVICDAIGRLENPVADA